MLTGFLFPSISFVLYFLSLQFFTKGVNRTARPKILIKPKHFPKRIGNDIRNMNHLKIVSVKISINMKIQWINSKMYAREAPIAEF